MNTIVVNYDTYADICWLSSSESSLTLFEDFIFEKFCYKIKNNSGIVKTITVEFFEGTKSGRAKEVYSNNKTIAVNWDFKQGIFQSEDIILDFENIEMMDLIEKEALECPNEIKYQTYVDGIFEQYRFVACCVVENIVKLCNYIMSANREKVYKESNKNYKNNNNLTTSSIRTNKKVFLLDEIVEYVHDNNLLSKNKSTHNIQCDCWGVRGHYRHYKNGKVVFVKEYKKGKNRDKKEPQGKIYTV